MRKQLYITIILLLININSVYSQINIYVSTSGNDTNTGTLAAPYLTITKARDYIRTINQNMATDIIVNILPGEYIITETINFTNLDNGTNGFFIKYQAYNSNNKPIISGGQSITNWTLYDSEKNIWRTNIGSLYSRQLYINGFKATRAKSIDANNLLESTTGYFSFCDIDNFFNWNLNPIQQRDLEVVSINEWKSNRVPIQSKCQSQLKVNESIWKYNHEAQFRCGTKATWLENAYNFIDTPNEWYIDRSASSGGNQLYLETIDSNPPTNIIIPQIETLIYGNQVNNLVFNGLCFQYTNWNAPSDYSPVLNSNKGLCLVQADWYYDIQSPTNVNGNIISSGVKFIRSNHINFKSNIFQHIGSIGLQFLENSSNNQICSNTFRDICATGISFGHPDNFDLSTSNSIKNNLIQNIANEYHGSAGINVTTASNTTISNNDISNFPLCGITIGWAWSSLFNTGTNTISKNKIDCSLTSPLMHDMGGIYTLGGQGSVSNKSKIERNYILNYHSEFGAIYLDQGSSYFDINNNVIATTITYSPKLYQNWVVISPYDARHVNCENNYISSLYPIPQNSIPYDPNHNSVPSDTLTIFVSPTNNTIINASNTATVTGIINEAGITSTNCN